MNQTQSKLFSKDFTLVVIGQIISLFGNAGVRFVLPLYLLNQTGSSVLYGLVTACAFIPTILMSPIGGIVADRVNKRNIMVVLDFFTAGVILGFSFLMGSVSLLVLMTVTLMILYGIAGAYQPSVQASVPALVEKEHFMAANSVINTISSLASLLGPVLGGILYSAYGLKPVLWICSVCFLVSAVMEIFIKIPFVKKENGEESNTNIRTMIKSDFAESIAFIRKEKPAIGKGMLVICSINLFLASMIIVGLPYMITEVLPFDSALANRLCGYAEGALAAGGLAGGISAGIFAGKLTIRKAGYLIIAAGCCVLPMGIVPVFSSSGMVNYMVIIVCCFGCMVCSTIFTVQMMSFVQAETSAHLIGKVIAVIFTISMCAQPVGNALYGVLFALCKGFEFAVILFAAVVSIGIAVWAKKVFGNF